MQKVVMYVVTKNNGDLKIKKVNGSVQTAIHPKILIKIQFKFANINQKGIDMAVIDNNEMMDGLARVSVVLDLVYLFTAFLSAKKLNIEDIDQLLLAIKENAEEKDENYLQVAQRTKNQFRKMVIEFKELDDTQTTDDSSG